MGGASGGLGSGSDMRNELGRVREQLKEMTEEKNMMQGKWEEAEHERHLFKEELEKLTGEEYGIEIEGQDGDATMS